jgi:hypothetical protein
VIKKKFSLSKIKSEYIDQCRKRPYSKETCKCAFVRHHIIRTYIITKQRQRHGRIV